MRAFPSATGADLTPLEERTSLMHLHLLLQGHTLDLSDLTELRDLSVQDASGNQNTLTLTAELPELLMLTVDRYENFPGALELVSYMPALEYIGLTAQEEVMDLSPLSQLTQLRAVNLDSFQLPVDLTPLAACPSLDMCSPYALPEGSIVPPGLPLELGSRDQLWAVYDEVQEKVNQAIWPTS